MIHMVNPRHKVNPVLLEMARKDYVNGFLPLLKLTSLTKYLRPLSLDETVNGIPGVRFIDALNMRTSMGFPLSSVNPLYDGLTSADEASKTAWTSISEPVTIRTLGLAVDG
jgi:hypothetical protein